MIQKHPKEIFSEWEFKTTTSWQEGKISCHCCGPDPLWLDPAFYVTSPTNQDESAISSFPFVERELSPPTTPHPNRKSKTRPVWARYREINLYGVWRCRLEGSLALVKDKTRISRAIPSTVICKTKSIAGLENVRVSVNDEGYLLT